jgi:serine-threonine kinase receptor-associated protein
MYTNVTEDGHFILSSGLEGKAILRDGHTGDWVGSFSGHKGAVWNARSNPNCTHVVTASADYTAKLWDSLNGNCLYTWKHESVVKAVAFTACSEYVYSGGMEKKIRLFDLNSPDKDPLLFTGHRESISSLCLTSNPNVLVSMAADDAVVIWDKRTAKMENKFDTGSSKPVSLQISHDLSTLVISAGKLILFYNAQDFSLITKLDMERENVCANFSPAGKSGLNNGIMGRLLTGCEQELYVRGYDVYTNGNVNSSNSSSLQSSQPNYKEVICLNGHCGHVRSVSFSPLGKFFRIRNVVAIII